MKAVLNALLICYFIYFPALAQETKYISLKKDKTKLSLKSFYIDRVEDSTGTNGVIGTVKKGINVAAEIKINQPLSEHVQAYLDGNTSHTQGANAIRLVISDLNVTINQRLKGYSAKAKARFTFYAGTTQIVILGTDGRIESGVLPLPQVEAFIKKACKSSLQQFDKWWQVHKDEVPLDTMAQVNVVIATSTDTPNRIVYSLARPLAYDDFAGDYTTKQGDEAAVTASGIGIEYKSSVEHSKLVVNVKLIPVFFKNNSWFKPEAKIENVLAHEQTHFDITAVKTCEFAARIRAATFTKNDYDKLLQAYLDEFTRITKEEEDKYDAETNHGLVRDKQIEWQEKVKAKLKEVGCY